MNVARFVRALTLALACTFVALPGLAAPDGAALEAAKRLFREGNELRKAGDCERAYVLYMRSKQLVPSAPNTVNAAYCAHRLGRWDEALELYEELVARFSSELSDDDRRAVAPAMAELRRKVGSLDVSANVEGIVVVDSRSRGKLPLLAPIRVLPGRRVVRVIADGYATFEQVVTVRAGEALRVDARLQPLRDAGRLRIDAPNAAGASVFVDGVRVGVVPWEGTLAPGEHLYWLERGDLGTLPRVARVIAGQTTRVAGALAPLGAALSIVVEPSTATLSIDGTPVGTGRWQGRLPRGEHSLEARELGYVSARSRVDGSRGGSLVLRLVIDESHPRWQAEDRGVIWVAALGGVALAPSLGSGAEQSCERFDCDRSLAVGGMVGVRVGYELPSHVSFAVTLGYLALGTTLERRVPEKFARSPGEPEIPTSYALEDELDFRAPFALAGASYRHALSSLWSASGSLSIGAAFAFSSDRVGASASGGGVERSAHLEGSATTTRSTTLLVVPELEVTRSLGSLALGVGVAAPIVVLGGPRLETGDLIADGSGVCGAQTTIECAPGESVVARERGYGPFVALVPYATVRYAF